MTTCQWIAEQYQCHNAFWAEYYARQRDGRPSLHGSPEHSRVVAAEAELAHLDHARSLPVDIHDRMLRTLP
jgi:hypothetical protein